MYEMVTDWEKQPEQKLHFFARRDDKPTKWVSHITRLAIRQPTSGRGPT